MKKIITMTAKRSSMDDSSFLKGIFWTMLCDGQT